MSEKSKDVVRKLLSKYIQAKPERITLKLDWDDKHSLISLRGNNLNQTFEYSETIDFTSFAHGVIEAYKQVYGELEVVPVSFREEIYRNNKVSLDLYPTGSAGIFDIYVEYREE